MPTRDSVLGCIVGGAIGDAAGSAFEGAASRNSQVWRITDDTQLTLATCQALATGKVDPERIAEGLLRCYQSKQLRGVGASTLKALRDLAAGCHWALAGREGEHAAGNGAAMRIAPLAFCTDPTTAVGRRLIRDVCRITHRNEEAYIGALATVLAIRLSVASPGEIASHLPDSVVRDRLNALADSKSIAEAARNGASGFVADSVPLAIFASQQVNTLGFTETLEQIIGVGGDTDTIASIACQIAGAALGLDRLPGHLVERLPEREMIMEIANRFADAVLQGRSSAP